MGQIICGQHGEKKKFFCEEDQIALCDSCLLAPEYKDHQVFSLEVAGEKCKEKLQEIRNKLQEKEEQFEIALNEVRMRKEEWEKLIHTLTQSVISKYEKVHQLLCDEFLCLQKVEEKYRDILEKLKDNKAKVLQQIQKLQEKILELKENLDEAPLEILQVTKIILEKNEELLHINPEEITSPWSICAIPCIREMLMIYQENITFDPETANPHLFLSVDLKSVKYGRIPQDLPDNDERFDEALSILGAQTFTSGIHYWEVKVGDNTEWEVGICKDSISRKGQLSKSPEDITTLEGFKSGNDFFIKRSYYSCISQPIEEVGIFVDCDEGIVAFCNVKDRALIYSTSKIAFQHPLRPYFSLCFPKEESTSGSLIICPFDQ
ncbi:probable E3 ubiquitin-protein ligase TRIML1 [Gracilinanus agilis]|uniref:probable E3 ubiquitin-protein ligase TRIML1 n=1 Tax=Gracilinanus agilis TaxID=191870 RepID=UPI001CFE2C9C|nr:probable E3 ubiquitin-protein ligase TRIML1 [Gracilinanus agilis]